MKKDDLKLQGLTDEQIDFVMAEYGKGLKKVQTELENVKEEKEKLQEQLNTAQETLKSFDGVNPEEFKKTIADYEKAIKDKDAEYAQKLADRDFNDLLKDSIRTANGLNEKAIMALLDIDTLKASKNQKEDVTAAIKTLTEAEDSKMLFKSTTEPIKKASFTEPIKKPSVDKSNAEIWKSMSLDERIRLKAENPERYAELRQ